MFRNVASKVMWVGRTASMVFGLALVMALVLGVAATAWSATGGNFLLGKANTATTVSKLTASVAGPALSLVNQSTEAAATALNLTVPAGKAPIKVNAAAGTATNLSADKVDGKSGEDLAQLDPATAQNGSLHHDGLVRSGSETGTGDHPSLGLGADYEGVMTRRVVSSELSSGSSVIARTDKLRLERDGYDGGMRIAWEDNTPTTNTVSCVYATGGSFDYAGSRTLPSSYGEPGVIGGSNPGSVTLFAHQQAPTYEDAPTYIDCSFGDPAGLGHVTQVQLQRAVGDYTWVGTVTSTVNQ